MVIEYRSYFIVIAVISLFTRDEDITVHQIRFEKPEHLYRASLPLAAI